MPRCLVALGSNLGDRAAQIARACAMLAAQPGMSALRSSRLYETRPIGGAADQPAYLNAAATFACDLSAAQLHAALLGTEAALGRQRGERWGPRTIDLDLLLYGEAVIDTPALVVPHPRMAFRRFVLEPAAEVAPDLRHPTIGWTVGQMLAHLNTAVPYVALLGLPGSGKTALARRLVSALGGRWIVDPIGGLSAAGDAVRAKGASPALRRQIELLDRRGQVLAAGLWPDERVLAVSDFYFDQGLAYAELALCAAEMEAYRRAHQRAAAEVVLPKLLVVLDTPPTRDSAPQAAARDEPLREKLLALAQRRGIGPVLYAGGADPDAQYAEASAALSAMR
jgi:2-amino-4-hydroxy-6-hydroxymethyldihydropteridine diphosphokinase